MFNSSKQSPSYQKWWLVSCFVGSMMLAPAALANRLETFVFDTTRNRIEFATSKKVYPKGKVLENPTRLVIDLPGARYKGATVRRTIGKAVQAVRVGQVDSNTTRLVVEFAPSFNLEDNEQLQLKALSSTSHWSVQLPQSVASSSLNTPAPMVWPVNGIITAAFGWRIHPITGQRRMHKGIDIGAPTGAPILAAADGLISYAEWDDGGYGNLVEVTHNDGGRTLYAHANRILVRKGQHVRQGQLIAEVGSTGRSTGPHLHFEVQSDGKRATNPMAFLPNRYIVFDVASR
jgi:murein DD-endopeptidase MepM/ murein hydrolase activator NlpD